MRKTIKILLILIIGLNMSEAKEYKFTNELINEESPYLLQHSHNPVNWIAWGNKAFEKAKKEDKLIFLSIGYSTCHWCHVMERETFENEKSAEILNKFYIPIKVDREERPDIDKYYQDIFYFLNRRSGGWPLTIVMTPDRKVIYSATYLPPKETSFSPSFNQVMSVISKRYNNEKDKIEEIAHNIQEGLSNFRESSNSKGEINLSILDEFVENAKSHFDEKDKGIGSAPKFPRATTFDTLLDIYKVTKNRDALKMSEESLISMAKGGINDQIEGGFYRYSVDKTWTIPHFEKMLYTNAELIQTYSKLYKITKNEFVKSTIQKTIQNMSDRFLINGLYKSASDADSEGEEGKYFVFKYEEALNLLMKNGFNEKDTKNILEYLNITQNGNFENYTSNPNIKSEIEPKNLDKAKSILKTLRSRVEYPFIDDKILTSWNSLMAIALFEAGEIDKKYSEKGVKLVESITKNLYKNGVLYHQLLIGKPLKVEGMLEDYSFFINALISTFQETQNQKYLDLALKLMNESMNKFYKNSDWYLSDNDFKTIAPLEDGSYRSAKAVMIENIYILALLTENIDLYAKAEEMLSLNANNLKRYPMSYAEAVKLVIISKKGEILLKAKKEKLNELKNIKSNLNYPFIYILEKNQEKLQACSVMECFGFTNNKEELEKEIKNYLKI